MSAINIPIVIPCYNRLNSLKRLIESLNRANYKQKVDIIFSIDKSNSNEIYNYLKTIKWNYGKIHLIQHKQNLGLKNNIIFCGNLTTNYDAVIVLEDDLIVAKDFYNYAIQAYEYYKDDDNIAGISLYKYEYTEINRHIHYPMDYGYDGYLMSWPSSWGQLWTKSQWNLFRDWLNQKKNINDYNIPIGVKQWSKNSWKKWAVAYLADTKRYFLYPYKSFTNEFGTFGTHYKNYSLIPNINTVCLYEGVNTTYKFNRSDLCPKYDCYFQPESKHINIKNNQYLTTFNIYNSRSKEEIETNYVISPIEISSNNIIAKFNGNLLPFETNLKEISENDFFFYLYKKDYITQKSLTTKQKIFLRIDLSKFEFLTVFILDIIIRIKRKIFR